jgi:hypothetical protein
MRTCARAATLLGLTHSTTRWSRKSLEPGDHIELQFNPLRDGKHGGAFKQAKLLETGQVLSSSVRDAERPGLKQAPAANVAERRAPALKFSHSTP